MNQKNVEALGQLIQEWWESDEAAAVDSLQMWLASKGVLLPSAMTLREGNELRRWLDEGRYGNVVETLERIAKGEAEW